MFSNSKRNADILPNVNGVFKVKIKTHGFITYRDPLRPRSRRWGRVVPSLSPLVEVGIKKAQISSLPNPLPLGVTLISKPMGAVVRFFLKGTQGAINQILPT